MAQLNYTWIEQIADKRAQQASTVALCETVDPLRFEELVEAASRIYCKKCAKWFNENKDTTHDGHEQEAYLEWGDPLRKENKIVYNLQKGTVTDLKGEPVPRFQGDNSPPTMAGLDAILHTKKARALIIIKWVFQKELAEQFQSALIEWSQSDEVKVSGSLVVILTSSLEPSSGPNSIGFWLPEVLRWSIISELPISTEAERERLLRKDLAELKVIRDQLVQLGKADSEPFELLQEHISTTRGLNLHDLHTATYESFYLHKQFRTEVFSAYKVKKILSTYNIRYVEPSFDFTQVKGYQYLKDFLRTRVIDPLLNPEKYHVEGIEPPKGMLLYGPPRIGKTYIANALAKESGLSMIEAYSSDFLGSLMGESEAKTRKFVKMVEQLSPIVVYFDEADAIMSDRRRANSAGDSGVRMNVISELMKWMGSKKREAFIFASTNFIQNIDPAILSAGRIDKSVIMLYPDYQSRYDMLQHYSQGKKLAEKIEWDSITKQTQWWNSAEIAMLPTEASYIRFEERSPETTTGHFQRAIDKSFQIDPAKRKTEMQTMIQNYVTSCPNYEPYLLEKAKETLASEDDKDMAAVFGQSMQK